MIEVEIKFRVPDDQLIPRLIAERRLQFGPPVTQQDIYFNHPQRNFRDTNEALRIRASDVGNVLTYKGARYDDFTRTRPEFEVPFQPGGAATEQMQTVLLALGFRVIETVKKTRRTAVYDWEGQDVEITIDEIPGLGQFIEIEVISEPEQWEFERDRIVRLAEACGLLPFREPRSYLRMLLEQQGVLSPSNSP